MGALTFAKDYFVWHYSTAIQEGLGIWKNFIWFISHFFSIGLLLRTLFLPWKRIKEYYGRGFDPQKYFETFFVNLIMRFVGFFVRGVFIIIGLAAEVGIFILGALAFVIWLAMPFFLILCLSKGIMLFNF